MAAKILRRLLPRCCLLAFVCAYPLAASPQMPDVTPATVSPLAIEIPAPNGCPQDYSLPNGNSVGVFRHRFVHPLPGFDPSARKPSGLRLEFETGTDTVSITATVLYGDFDLDNAIASVGNISHQTIATHSGKLNDRVAFPELAGVGLEPITFRVVTSQSETSYHPVLRSNAPSIHFDYATLDRTHGTLTLHNLSAKAIIGFQIGNNSDGRSGWSGETMQRIAPGASGHTDITEGSSSFFTGTCVEAPKDATIFLQAVLFDDFSYEGNTYIAAKMAVGRLGSRLQSHRIKSLAEPILADAGLDDATRIERIRAAIRDLTIEPDADSLARLRAQFPGLPESDLPALESEFRIEMNNRKLTADDDLRRYASDELPGENPGAFAQWWTQHQEH
jgi:hypothetical protein